MSHSAKMCGYYETLPKIGFLRTETVMNPEQMLGCLWISAMFKILSFLGKSPNSALLKPSCNTSCIPWAPLHLTILVVALLEYASKQSEKPTRGPSLPPLHCLTSSSAKEFGNRQWILFIHGFQTSGLNPLQVLKDLLAWGPTEDHSDATRTHAGAPAEDLPGK